MILRLYPHREQLGTINFRKCIKHMLPNGGIYIDLVIDNCN